MRTLKTTIRSWIPGLFLLTILESTSSAQSSDTIWIPVTYFDFHSDGTNPEFQQKHTPSVVRNMVAPTLDSNSLPTLGTNPFMNMYIKYWFRPWDDVNGSKGVFSIPSYDTTGKFLNMRTVQNDESFKNFVVQGSLPFTKVPNSNLYEFIDTTFFPLDGERFGSEGLSHNYSFTMALHYTFTKTKNSIQQTLNFIGDDDVWGFVDKQLVLDIGGIHNSEQGSFVISDTLITGKQYQFDFFFAERHTADSKIKIQTNLFTHQPPVIIISVAPNDTVRVGDTALVNPTVWMDGEDRPDLAKKVIWRVVDAGNNPDSTFWCNKEKWVGDSLFFAPTVAPRKVILEAGVFDSIASQMIYAFDTLWTKVGRPHHLVIEESPDFSSNPMKFKDSINDNPIEKILIGYQETKANAYAVVRDKEGNLVGLSNSISTVWTQLDGAIISASGEPNSKYHGIITRIIDNGRSLAVVDQPNTPSIRGDSVIVELINVCIDSLRLKDTSTDSIVEEIKINSGEKRSYVVEGRKSTEPYEWILVDAKWSLSLPIKSAVPPPDRNKSWTFDPIEPGSDILTLSRPFDEECIKKPVTVIPVLVTIEKPFAVELSIITPVSERIAGDTLDAVVKITNSDGVVPGTYCFGDGGNELQKVIYQDTLENPASGKRLAPRIYIDGVWTDLNMGFSDEIKNNQCFTNGLDTIKIISYYAPYNSTDSSHMLTANIGENRRDQKPFVVLPAILDSLDITDNNHVSITAIESFTTDGDGKYYISVGYDKYGNRRGDELSDWNTSGEIMDSSASGVLKFYFGPGKAAYPQSGKLSAKMIVNGKSIEDSIDIQVSALPAQMITAYTRDDNGNGYLDRIVVAFDKKVNISEDNTALFKIANGIPNTFTVTKILPVSGDSIYSIYVKEIITQDAQTDWKPLISSGDQKDFKANDSAAPVVWKVEKYNDAGNDRKKDILIITLSEPIKRADNNKFTTTNQPDLTFNVWKKDVQDTSKYVLLDTLLRGIDGFLEDVIDKTFKIKMINGNDVTDQNFINIKDQNRTLKDNNSNFPNEKNIKQRVIVYSKPVPPVVIPNPTSPSFEHIAPGVLNLSDDRDARKHARNGKGAAINIILPNAEPGETVKAYIKIYDIAGNIVTTSHNNDFLKAVASINYVVGSVHNIDIYWNGSNIKGMKVAPGIYKTVLYFTYSKQSTRNLRYVVNIGITK